jgi:hypothetical protein
LATTAIGDHSRLISATIADAALLSSMPAWSECEKSRRMCAEHEHVADKGP